MAQGIIRISLPPRPEVIEEWVTQALARGASRAIQLIKIRTARGVDADGRAFRPYTRRYAILKGSTARRVSPPDLTLSGAMLGNLKTLRVQKRQVVIGFEGQHRQFRFGRRTRKDFVTLRFGQRPVTTGKRTLKRTTASGEQRTTSMAAVVLGNNKIRPFFHIRSKADIRAVIEAAQAEIDRLVRASKGR